MEGEASMKLLALSPQYFWFLLDWNENLNEQQEYLHFKRASVFFLQILQQWKSYNSGTSGPLVGPVDPHDCHHKTHPCYLHFVTRTDGCLFGWHVTNGVPLTNQPASSMVNALDEPLQAKQWDAPGYWFTTGSLFVALKDNFSKKTTDSWYVLVAAHMEMSNGEFFCWHTRWSFCHLAECVSTMTCLTN